MPTALAQASPNIAFVKYWGNRNQGLRLPSNGSISMTLEGLETRTSVSYLPELTQDEFWLDGSQTRGQQLERVTKHLDHIRSLTDMRSFASVESQNNFPAGVGIASSASAFASLTLAACAAAGMDLDPKSLSRLARLGSGSACRSIFGGFVRWFAADRHEESYAEQIAPANHWGLVDLVAVASRQHKAIGSTAGHALAETSPLQPARVEDAPRRLELCQAAILARDFSNLAPIVEQDSNMMHAVMQTSTPPLLYWQPATVAIMQAVREWRRAGIPVCYSVDAGPNVHCLCLDDAADDVARRLEAIEGVLEVRRAGAGGPARLL